MRIRFEADHGNFLYLHISLTTLSVIQLTDFMSFLADLHIIVKRKYHIMYRYHVYYLYVVEVLLDRRKDDSSGKILTLFSLNIRLIERFVNSTTF